MFFFFTIFPFYPCGPFIISTFFILFGLLSFYFICFSISFTSQFASVFFSLCHFVQYSFTMLFLSSIHSFFLSFYLFLLSIIKSVLFWLKVTFFSLVPLLYVSTGNNIFFYSVHNCRFALQYHFNCSWVGFSDLKSVDIVQTDVCYEFCCLSSCVSFSMFGLSVCLMLL